MIENQTEPGPVTVIGPECFASADESVICWRGENYYRVQDLPLIEDELMVAPACTTCGLPIDDPQWCSRNPATGKGGHTHGGGVGRA